MAKLKRLFRNIKVLLHFQDVLDRYQCRLDTCYEDTKKENGEIKIMIGKALLNQQRYLKQIKSLQDTEFKVFSQWGDDGIIQFLVHNVEMLNKSFIEFGVQNYKEANTRFLLVNNNWKGLVFDSAESNVEQIKKEDIYWEYDLTAKTAFITAENINQLISDAGFTGDIGLLHIDIDGNDYWVWKAINTANPPIVIVEYNSVFGIDRAITIPYDPFFNRTKAHYSNLYFGASLLSLCDLAEEKGYFFIGCNSNGNNAYFIRKDKVGSIRVLPPKEGYTCSTIRESRNKEHKLTHLGGKNRLELIKGMSVYNTRESKLETL